MWSIGSGDPRILELLSNRQRIPTDESRLNVLKREDGRVDRDRLRARISSRRWTVRGETQVPFFVEKDEFYSLSPIPYGFPTRWLVLPALFSNRNDSFFTTFTENFEFLRITEHMLKFKSQYFS